MLFTIENTKGKKVKVTDVMGKEITLVKEYDTETRKAKLGIRTKDEKGIVVIGDGVINAALFIEVELTGSRISVDGVEY